MPKRQLNFVLVETEQYGTLHLRSSLLFKDFVHLSEIVETNASAREFTVQAVSCFLYRPEIDIAEIRSWNDVLLTEVATTWAKEQGESKWPLPENLSPYEAFQHGYKVYSDSIRRDMAESLTKIYLPSFDAALEPLRSQLATIAQELADINRRVLEPLQASINLMVEAALGPLRENISRIVGSFALDIDVGRLLPALPDLSELRKRYEEAERAADVLGESGYPFMRYQWSLSEIGQFVGIEQIPPRVRDAAITNRLLGLTRSDDFHEKVESYFRGSSILQRRWGIVEQAFDAHQKRQYALSVPALLAQIEGIFTDALILRNVAVLYGGKPYVKDMDGNVKLDRNGQPVRLQGLGQKVQHSRSRFGEDEILHDLVEFFAERMVTERNDIMHGNSIDYDKAKLSVQLMLNIYVLAAEFAELESEN